METESTQTKLQRIKGSIFLDLNLSLFHRHLCWIRPVNSLQQDQSKLRAVAEDQNLPIERLQFHLGLVETW